MKLQSGLRKRIEETIGREIMKKYCQEGGETSGPLMMPPIPDSKFIDRLPEDVVLEGANVQEKEHQDAYVAEVKLYRCFEEIKKNHLVIHQLEYTHEQYSAFLPEHRCNKKKCKKGPEDHRCHKQLREIEGECDFVVVGDHFVAVFEVKGLCVQDTEDDNIKLEGCCDSARTQRKRTRDLIKSIDSLGMIYEFTVFPNISMEEVDEQYLNDETILFSDDLENLRWIINSCETFSSRPVTTTTVKTTRDTLCCCLLGLWCINQDNKWALPDCSLSKCIKDTDEKLRRSLVTRGSVDEAKQNQCSGKKKGKQKKYPQNSGMVQATNVFKDYLKISCLTKDQFDLFNSVERFLWVEGPAGSGKTVAMLGKIIQLALTTPPEKRILVMLEGHNRYPAPIRHLELLNNIRQDITCESKTYDYSELYGDISGKLDKARRSLLQELSDSTCKIVLLTCMGILAKSIDSLILGFDYVFFDDFQRLYDTASYEIKQEPSCADKNIISEGLLPIVKNSSTNNTSMWIFCDIAQSSFDRVAKLMSHKFKYLSSLISVRDELRSYFVNSKELLVNLRNSFEISTLLSIIRKHYENMDFAGTLPVKWPQQEGGHFIRGTKPTIYVLRTNETSTLREVVTKELGILKGSGSCLKNKDIAVLFHANDKHIKHCDTVRGVVERWNTTDDQITMLFTASCMSAEWPAVIFICKYIFYRDTVTLPDKKKASPTFSETIQLLYTAISRARVYSTVILLDYIPNTCQYTDKLLEELKQRRDVCRIIEQ